MSDSRPAILVEDVHYQYAGRNALTGVSFSVGRGEVFGLLGPNGSGKTTLFRVLATLLEPQRGRLEVFGEDVRTQQSRVREHLGVVFQAPSVDGKLTVWENVKHHGRLYGLAGATLRLRAEAALARVGLTGRRDWRVETLSGGERRRVELAKGLVTRPRLLLLDEPTTGLDPVGRRLFWESLRGLRDDFGITVVATTHLMDEAELCDRIAIIDRGRLVAQGRPGRLRAAIGGEVMTIRSSDPAKLRDDIQRTCGAEAALVDGLLRIEHRSAHCLVERLIERFGDQIQEITLAKPTLEDVFVHYTGHRFRREGS
ncbi:MAG: ABC transporter ATP-binding protein [Candidatus Dadabacteria bacterium]|nr:MAG: ABC transporter ATP-binding protein [Candidatus Dadabacteria bacterium]